MIDYLTRWAKETLVKDSSVNTTTKFLFENFVMYFTCLTILMTEKGTHFLNQIIKDLMKEFQIYHQKSTPYHL